MPKNNLLSRLSIKINLVVPLGAVFLAGFALFISIITADQVSKKTADFEIMKTNTMELIAMTNIANLWNMDLAATEQNLTSFLKNKEIISIEIKDAQDNGFKKLEKEKKGGLTVQRQDIMREEKKLGSIEVWFTDYYIIESRDAVITIFLIMGIVIFGLLIFCFIVITNYITAPIAALTSLAVKVASGETGTSVTVEKTRSREIAALTGALERMTGELHRRAERFRTANEILTEIIRKAREIIINLNTSTKEIEAAAQEQTSGTNEFASGITEVSATLEELTITARQITKNVGELVFASEEAIKNLKQNEGQLLQTVSQLSDVGAISRKNAQEIGELGKRSLLINEMVELIKDVANKTNILSINASIEASRSGEAGSGFAVVAAEIRELSKETISSARNVEKAAWEIRDFIASLVIATENESAKVVESGNTVKTIHGNIGGLTEKIGNNYSFTQKIDVSIKQQENGSTQAADTMRQMADISRQSAGTARQILQAVKEIVEMAAGLNSTIDKIKAEDVKLDAPG
jgi:methyl-accepting chemotaxis protein